MELFEAIKTGGIEQLMFFNEHSVGLRGVAVIHNTQLGPAVAGIRVMEYASEQAMIVDAIDLANEMTMRAALAECDLGGGSIVLWGPPPAEKREAYFRALGKFLERLGGRVYGVMEVGTEDKDIRNVRRETRHVLALSRCYGGISDATQLTADGVLLGIKATAKSVLGAASLANLTCLVQGLGRLGRAVAAGLTAAKARLIVTDLSYDKIKAIQDANPESSMVRPEEVVATKCDILVPCALGNVVTVETAARLRCRAVAGGASNIIPDIETADALHQAGVVYTPHYIIDSGELLQADAELTGRSLELVERTVAEIYPRTLAVLETARDAKESPVRTTIRMANNRISAINSIGRHMAF
ncbi:MAG: Glu/Leu/Phe/Val dehydrogenase dimerization domain-containing protein [Pseudomonadota bacterium]